MSDIHPENFGRYARFYALFNQEKDYESEVAYLCKQIRSYAPDAQSILELGAGAGGHGRLLKKKGFEVMGIERSAEMAALAAETGIDVVVGDISNVVLERRFDVALSLFHVISYLTGEAELENTFRLTWNHLRENGIFIFDVWYTDAVESQGADIREKTVVHEGMRISRTARPLVVPEKKTVNVTYEFSVRDLSGNEVECWEEMHPMKHFSTDEIEELAARTGFELLGSEGYLSGAVPSEQTWGVCYILRKTENQAA